MDLYNTGPVEQVSTTRRFFESICPLLIQAYPEVTKKIGGRYAFCIAGAESSEWVINLDEGTVTEAEPDTVDLNVSTWQVEFERILAGQADIAQLVKDKKFFVAGNPQYLMRLAQFLSLASP